MLLIGKPTGRTKGATIVVMIRKPRSKYQRVACFGPSSHYDKAGRCVHTDELVSRLKPEVDRALVRVLPFGDKARKTIPCQSMQSSERTT